MEDNLGNKIEKIAEMQDSYKTPWTVMRTFGKIHILGDQVCFGDSDNDFVNINELKHSIEALVKELNGTVKWKK